MQENESTDFKIKDEFYKTPEISEETLSTFEFISDPKNAELFTADAALETFKDVKVPQGIDTVPEAELVRLIVEPDLLLQKADQAEPIVIPELTPEQQALQEISDFCADYIANKPERAMAVVKRIDKLSPIPDADKIEVAKVGGWNVIAQKGLYKENDLVVMVEVDAFVPSTVAPFLTKPGKTPKEYLGVQGERLKTMKMKGVISQGLLLPLSEVFPAAGGIFDITEGADVSEFLGIVKYEPPEDAVLGGSPKGNFPSFIPKTKQERIQNLSYQFREWQKEGRQWCKTEKLHGSSMTAYVRDDAFGVCSRNQELLQDEANAYWRVAVRDGLEDAIRRTGRNFAVQGELVGPGINGNQYNLSELQFYVFDIFDIDTQEYLLPEYRQIWIDFMFLASVPVVGYNVDLSAATVDSVVEDADGESALSTPKPVKREGWVYSAMDEGGLSFKVVSAAWLLKNEG